MDEIDPTQLTPPELFAMLERGRADAAAGRTVPIETILEELRASLARMEQHRTDSDAA